ncbi:aldehyde dehydrogenase [Trametes meyenii]|nr:aldehyde dehydrogenase [Trametes meyenii]
MSVTYTALEDIPKVPTYSHNVRLARCLLLCLTLPCVTQIHATAQKAFLAGKAKSIAFRKKQIAQVGYLVKDNEQRFKDAMKADLGRPHQETEFVDFLIIYGEARQAYDNVEKWAQEQAPDFSLNWFFMRPRLKAEPKGTVLVIAPFNYPLFLLLVPLISAIAGGNAAVLKPPEHTPVFSALLAELLPKYLDPDLYHVINGAVPETTKILELQWDHTDVVPGNTRVGRIIAEAAAKYLTPLTLESLLGKNPVVVDPKVDLAMTARRVLWGRMSNAGQICLAPEYVLVPEEAQEALVAAFGEAYHSFYPEGPKNSASFGRIVNEAHAARIKKLIDETKGTIEFGGDVDVSGKYVAPTLVSNARGDDSLMEIFGPVLVVIPVKDVDEAIAFIRAREYPLGIYIFSHDKNFQDRVIDNTQSGAVMINDTLVTVAAPGLPVGGKGSSGYGYYTSKYGFDQFVHMRVSINNPSWIDKFAFWFRFPPYTEKGAKQLRLLETKLPPRPDGPNTSYSTVLAVFFTAVVVGVSFVAFLRSSGRM